MLNERAVYNMNYGWRFCDHDSDGQNFGSVNGRMFSHPEWMKAGNNGLAVASFDDSSWETVNLPHDFVIEKCKFTKEEVASAGSLENGTGWYRKKFRLPEGVADKRIFIKFDGVYRDCEVWCNGHFIGRHLGGYMGFEYELTEVIYDNSINTIAIRVDATQHEGWWYEGGGIYRDTWITATPQVRIGNDGLYAKVTDVDTKNKTCTVQVEAELDSNLTYNADIEYSIKLLDSQLNMAAGKSGSAIAFRQGTSKIFAVFELKDITLWDIYSNNLYTVELTIKNNNHIDSIREKFGIRKIYYSAKEGMLLNDKKITLNGFCGHDDFAGVGTALTKSVIRYKLNRLKSIGCNAYRCSHNPPSPLMLELCDEMGILVMDETRLPGTSKETMDDFIALIKRDRNHPCVFAWSMGNEEMVIQGTKTGVKIFNKMIDTGKCYDDTRNYLLAINCEYKQIISFHEENGLSINPNGTNYLMKRNFNAFEEMHSDFPEMCLISTENAGCCSVRGYRLTAGKADNISQQGRELGIWSNEKFADTVSCYGDFYPIWGLTPEESLKSHDGKPYMLGQFLWTGFDYRGETFPFEYPNVITCYGIIDLCGIYKDWAYYLMSSWLKEDILHVFPHWNLNVEVGEKVQVWAFSNCEKVELFLNGRSLGIKEKELLDHYEWEVPYEKGVLKAIGYRNDKTVAEDVKVTSGKECRLELTTEKDELTADCNDCTIINVAVKDENGFYVTDSEIEIQFRISGNGTIKGTGNGNPRSLEHDKAPSRRLYAGQCIVIVEGTFDDGEIIVSASAANVTGSEIKIASHPCDTKNYIFAVTRENGGSEKERVFDDFI